MQEGFQVMQQMFRILRERFQAAQVVQGRPGLPGAGKCRIQREGFQVVQKKSPILQEGLQVV